MVFKHQWNKRPILPLSKKCKFIHVDDLQHVHEVKNEDRTFRILGAPLWKCAHVLQLQAIARLAIACQTRLHQYHA